MKMLATNTAYAPAHVLLARCELDEAYESGYDWDLAAGVFYQRAYARSKDGELRDRAVASFRKTLELDPANSVAQKALDELTRN